MGRKEAVTELSDAHPVAEIAGRGPCPACGAEMDWRLTVTCEALGMAFYWAMCGSCHEETMHSIDMLAGRARSWEPGV
jgi:hypothetical protein